jgi:hypothetical protein
VQRISYKEYIQKKYYKETHEAEKAWPLL